MKTKKLKGGFKVFITEDEKMLVTLSSRNIVYIYELESGKLLQQFKTLSNVSRACISKDKKKLAAKNTSGTIILISLEDGEEMGKSTMECREGEAMVFTSEDAALLDFDWDGRTMLFHCQDASHQILDGPAKGMKEGLPRTSYMHYDRYSDQIYKFVSEEYGNSKGKIMVSRADPQHIAYETVQEFEDRLPDHIQGISFCREHNYFVDGMKKQFVMTDKKFLELSRFQIPDRPEYGEVFKFWVSEGEKYLFMDFGKQCDSRDFQAYKTARSLSCLYSLDTMEKIEKFEYDYVSDFRMYDEDTKFILATWKGSYMGRIE